MLIRTIHYTDFDGNPTSDKFHFHLSKAELAKLEMRYEGGLTAYIRTIVEKKNAQLIIETFEDIIAMSYGVRSEDGKRFIKNNQLVEEFKQTEAYAQLFYELCTDGAAGAIFIRGVIPADLAAKLPADTTQISAPVITKELLGKSEEDPEYALTPDAERRLAEEIFRPEESAEALVVKKFEDYTKDQLLTMAQAEFDRLVGKDPKMMPRVVLQIAFERRMRNDKE